MAGIAVTDKPATPMPARRGAWAIYEVFETAGGGALFIGVTSDQQWLRFTEEFGLDRLAADPRLATNLMRGNERSWLIPALKEVIGRLPQEEVARRCERANISWSPVAEPADLFADAHLLATGGLLDVFISRAGGGEGKLVGLPTLPVEFGPRRERPTLRRQPPRLGEHNAEVLAEAGFSPAEIAALWEAKVIAAARPAA
jgi:crotonobetainyl-CoA:carnitine CoA-transferase CaiB-like acyl-CoA transferase